MKREIERRGFLGGIAASVLGDFFSSFVDDGSETDEEFSAADWRDQPASSINNYPLQHGEEVDADSNAHHTRPSAGAFLSEDAAGFGVDVRKESDTWTMGSTSNGTHTYSLGRDYSIALAQPVLPVSGSILNDLRVVTKGWQMTDGLVTGVKVAWTNGTTSDHDARIEVLGFVE